MRAVLLCLATTLVAPCIDAAPAPSPGQEARKKLEALKKRLPGIITEWVKEEPNTAWLYHQAYKNLNCKPELRVLRRVSPYRAKALIYFTAYSAEDRCTNFDVVLTVYLIYQDDCWTTESFESFQRDDYIQEKPLRGSFAFLMMAIDEAAGKP